MGPLSSAPPGPESAAMLARGARLVLAVCLLGVLARVLAIFLHGPLHPDEFFQYLEPAYFHLTGVGIEAWEFRDGLRSWLLPFYNGAWIAAFMAVGVSKGETLVRLVQVQTALLNALIIWSAYRGGASCARKLRGSGAGQREAGFFGGAFAALLCATFPYLIVYAGHTLSEQPSMLLLLSGLVEISELSEEEGPERRATLKKAALAGALLSLSACLRIANGPLVLIAPVWLLATRRYRSFFALGLAALGPALVCGLTDLFTWGKFAHSYVAYVKFNFIEGKAADFGTAPAYYYFEILWKRSQFAAPVLLVVACLGIRRNFLFLLPALFGLAYLSTQAHKEERFILFIWPLLLTAAGAVLGASYARARSGELKGFARVLRGPVVLVIALATPIDSALHLADLTWLGESRFVAETVVAQDPTLTGLLVDAPIFAGGSLWLGLSAPHMDFNKRLLENPLISHALVESDSKERTQAEAQGFKAVRYVRDLVILRQPPAQR